MRMSQNINKFKEFSAEGQCAQGDSYRSQETATLPWLQFGR
jgi:hypothetical protein